MKKFSLVETYYPQLLLLIIAFTFFTRMYNLHVPEKYVFDEVYHSVTAKLIAKNDTRAYEWNNPPPEPNTAVDWLHPPYAKYTQALSISVFGENTFAWRFPSVIFGCLVIFLTAQIAKALFADTLLALTAAFLASLDGLIFAMSRIAMNDIHVTALILLSIYLYISFLNSKRKTKKLLLLSGIAAGFAVGTKWSGVFVIAILSILEAVHILQPIIFEKIQSYKKTNKLELTRLFSKQEAIHFFSQTSFAIFSLVLIPIVLYILSYSHMFLLGKNFTHLLEMHKNIWWYQTTLSATHPAQSQPIEWFLNTKPVWISVDFSQPGLRGDIYAIGNPMLFIFGVIAVVLSSIGLLVHRFIRPVASLQQQAKKVALVLFIYFLLWVPWQLSPRIMFFYHYLPAVPLLCINLAFWLKKLLENTKSIKIFLSILGLIFITFIIWYPHLTLIPVSTAFKDAVYFYFDFWRQK